MSPHKIDALPSAAALASYGISENGFLPAEYPLLRLPHAYYEPWESIVDRLPDLLEAREVRQRIDALSVLDTSHLSSDEEWRRAYSILAVLAQAYIWQGPEPSESLPPQISVAFLDAAERLEVHPVATYAALNLWNWRPIEHGIDLCQPQNMVALLTQTGTDDESWFFIVSNAMEARAGPIIIKMLAAMEAVEWDEPSRVIDSLEYFQQSIDDIGRLLERMDERCRPQTFYHHIRPFLAGSLNMEAAGLPNGVFYDEGNGKGSWRKYRGGSNGQSSLLQFFDAVLGVNHARCNGFHAEMRDYMPGPHKRFLDDIEAIANIRNYVDSHQENIELLAAYNAAVSKLSGFRDKHIALVSRYIIVPSRMGNVSQATGRKDLASSTSKLASEAPSSQELVGTGGTKLIPFLRTSRDETSEAVVAR
ncbi:indoleamine 2,3-dioxygenase [Lecanosticta acicola]|uniref:Indoleamine 2,3-dioxygenase n=1 Tax=Lecanosticta acicola TaxID=111012 RepID=A0AAI8YSZ9_9PEZI|nr:indoleamine 2,3-dioxygenase [Lecanosticta acicola]